MYHFPRIPPQFISICYNSTDIAAPQHTKPPAYAGMPGVSHNMIESINLHKPRAAAYTCGTSPLGSRFVMLRRLMARVERLCSSADVVGGRKPATPLTISSRLKLTIKR